MDPFCNKGYNITLDNFFTSVDLAKKFIEKSTTIIGTIRKNRRDIPNREAEFKKKELYSSEVLTNKKGCSLTIYKGKKSKNVYILSTIHQHVKVNMTHPKRLPESVQYYNNTKYGVDVMDQMARHSTCKTGTRRWPVACFFNMLDLCAINSWILYKKTTNSNISRRKFMINLINQLCKTNKSSGEELKLEKPKNVDVLEKRGKCQTFKCNNKTSNKCHICSLICCGKHTSEKTQIVICTKCKKQS